MQRFQHIAAAAYARSAGGQATWRTCAVHVLYVALVSAFMPAGRAAIQQVSRLKGSLCDQASRGLST